MCLHAARRNRQQRRGILLKSIDQARKAEACTLNDFDVWCKVRKKSVRDRPNVFGDFFTKERGKQIKKEGAYLSDEEGL